jgi:gamma-glutamyltranspeptidase/glutathione hydrolase
MVCSVDQLASSAGVALLRAGGSAVDAAIAASAVLAVTTPHMCGMGGDLWALVHDGGPAPLALNASGRAGSGADPDALRAAGHRAMPFEGDVRSVPVPGCVDGWCALHDRFGRLPLAEVLAPAAGYARDGFPAGPLLAALLPLIAEVEGADDLVRDPPLRAGDRVTRPGVARALEAVATEGRDGFYGGEFGDALLDLGRGEYLPDDLARHQADWVDPLVVDAWDHQVWSLPPNSQGYVTLTATAIAARLALPSWTDEARPHLLVEALKQASFDRPSVLHERADGTTLLAPERVRARRDAIDAEHASPLDAPASDGDTIYLCAVDRDGQGVSLIQSNASAFGVGLAVGDTGILLHNRGIGFSLEPGHPAEYGPGRRPPSTLAPVLVTRPDGGLRAVLGTMGGDGQPAVVLQMLVRLLHDRTSPGTVVASPRWVLSRQGAGGFDTWTHDAPLEVVLERDAPEGWADGLRRRGHLVRLAEPLDTAMGHAHAIEIDRRADDEHRAGAADPRAVIGAAAGY